MFGSYWAQALIDARAGRISCKLLLKTDTILVKSAMRTGFVVFSIQKTRKRAAVLSITFLLIFLIHSPIMGFNLDRVSSPFELNPIRVEPYSLLSNSI